MFKFANPLGFHEISTLRNCTLAIELLFACLASNTYAQSDASSINLMQKPKWPHHLLVNHLLAYLHLQQNIRTFVSSH